ncbi:hypothetical protein LJC74_00360, partial [Eubacteriales bacterium OttesenSCG-928-A19]|nr:hypothetical protein [Eubacteriales bacterium OttesenSCG-928-A19]
MEQLERDNRSLGRLTYTDLSETDEFFRARAEDPWGITRAPLSPAIARMSAELCAGAYDLDIRPWVLAGWEDCTFVVEDRIVVLDHDPDSRLAQIEAEWKRRRAMSLMEGVSPVTDITRAIRQMMVTDLGKAIVMTRMDEKGRMVIAISFIGTTQKYFDWFSNFKIQRKTGMHSGFAELARGLDAQTTRILLPKLAAMLGEETFSLADALQEARQPNGRVRLWLTGHSQGGAIVQTYTHLLLSQGVLPEAIDGYTFAAPTVAAADGSFDPAPYPIHNIISTDDVVTRVGAQVRLGMDWIFRPNETFRKKHYRVQEDQKPAFDRALHIARQVQSTPDAICWFLSLMRLMRESETDPSLQSLFTALMPRATMLRRLKLSVADVAAYFEEKIISHHLTLTGEPPSEALTEEYEGMMRSLVRQYGPKPAAVTLLKILGAPHRIRPDKHDDAFVTPYIAIARR